MSFDETYLRAAHRHTSNHRKEVEASEVCGCFYCCATYPPSAIERWLNEESGTALCAECQIDSVLGDKSGYPVGDPKFLKAMYAFWFERTVHVAN